VRSGQQLDEFPQIIAPVKDEIARLKGNFAQTVAEAVTSDRQSQLSEEATALKSWVFPIGFQDSDRLSTNLCTRKRAH
jgi:hypothetical protein